MPSLACQLPANAVSSSRPEPRVWIAPPSASAGRPAEVTGGTASAADMAHPRVEDSVRDVRGQAPGYRGDSYDKRGSEQHREVMLRGGAVEEQAHPGKVEDRLRDDRAAHDVRQRETDDRDDRQQ